VLDIFLKDLRYSARLLLRSPGFTLTAIAALALGIAVNSAMFSVVNAVLLKPFAYPDPDRIVMFQSTFPAGRTGSASPTLFNWWRQQTASFEDISAYEFNVANWTGTSSPEQIPIMHVSAGFLALSRANPVYGRTFTPADDLPHGPKTVVLTWSFWQRSFGADPGVIGRRMTLNGEPHEIIGVLGPAAPNTLLAEQSLISGDIEINDPPDLYIPFQLDPASALQGRYFNVAARLKPGITLAAANGQLQASYSGYARKWPNDFTPGASFAVEPLQNAITGGVRNSLLILLGAVALVLLIACANVANLLLARAADRKREMAIRAAVGAGRSRILRQLLTESLILSLTGGMLGSMAGYFGIRAILTLVPPNIPRLGPAGANVELDWRVFAFTATLSILTGIAFGLAPAWQSSRTDLTHALKNSGHRATGLDQNRTRAVLVAAEMALAVVLLIGAALLIRTFVAIRQVHPGFEARNVVTLNTSLVGPQFARPAAVVQVIRQGLRRVRDLPGVQAAAVTCCVPLETRLSTGIRSLARPQGPTLQGAVGWTPVSAGYFNALRIPVLRGREFTDGDDTGPRVAIINQSLAKQFWPASDPLHDRIVIGNQTPREIVAVVGDVRDSALHLQPRPMLYTPIAQMSDPETTMLSQTLSWVWVIRTRAAPLVLSSALQDTVRQASGGLPVARVRTMIDTLSRSTAAGDFETLVLAIFGGSALLLAAIGVYGLMAYSVTRRTQEIGIRLALGAASIHIRNMVVAQGLRPALTGIGCGLAAAFGLTRLLAGLLFGVDPRDTLAFTIVPAILLAVALLAVWLPAIRASRVDPSLALRQD
jgi:predicted permease